MSSSTVHPASDEPTGYESLRLRTHWSERLTTVVATLLGVMLVAAIAVLMGMA